MTVSTFGIIWTGVGNYSVTGQSTGMSRCIGLPSVPGACWWWRRCTGRRWAAGWLTILRTTTWHRAVDLVPPRSTPSRYSTRNYDDDDHHHYHHYNNNSRPNSNNTHSPVLWESYLHFVLEDWSNILLGQISFLIPPMTHIKVSAEINPGYPGSHFPSP